MTTTGRRGRLFRRAEDELDDQDADLSGDEHAWWAAREGVAAVPRGTSPEPEAPEAHASGFSDYWSPESLFEEPVGTPDPPPPPPIDATDPTPPAPDEPVPEVPGGMDLDSAHLVLQVSIGVSWEEITVAHRKLAKLYHPDRLMDHSHEAQELGRTRMAEINGAHSTLRALHFH